MENNFGAIRLTAVLLPLRDARELFRGGGWIQVFLISRLEYDLALANVVAGVNEW